jgi:hypothetical protein
MQRRQRLHHHIAQQTNQGTHPGGYPLRPPTTSIKGIRRRTHRIVRALMASSVPF